MAGMDEFALIRYLTEGDRGGEPGKQEGVVVGIGDDAAVVEHPAGFQLVLTCDTMVQGIHFLPETMAWADTGFKAMASNISDIAAMGAIPRYALIALSAPRGVAAESLRELYDGMYECAGRYGVHIIGGDTTSSTVGVTVTVTLTGEVEQGKALLRSSAKPGDAVFVTGPLGLSAAGLYYLLEGSFIPGSSKEEGIPAHVRPLVQAHRRPLPQVEAGRLLLQSGYCGALNDISDGLASEAWEIAEASGCGMMLWEDGLPIDPNLTRYARETGKSALDWMLYGGEDYRLVGTVPREFTRTLTDRFIENGLSFNIIGETVKGKPDVRMRMRDGRFQHIGKKGYNHFI